MLRYEYDYALLAQQVLQKGEIREGRNGRTKALFATSLVVDMTDSKFFPLLTGRKMFYKGVFGELAAMLRGPKHVKDFEKFGCNYWKDWANEDGSLRVDYGNSWIDYNGVNQLDNLIDTLRNNPHDRRMLITSWRPDRLKELSLPCCHHTYQWFVRDGKYLDMLWMQRSADTMIGIPSDVILAAAWNIMIANEVCGDKFPQGLQPGKITMSFGDTHIYEEHWEKAEQYIDKIYCGDNPMPPTYTLAVGKGCPAKIFYPTDIIINNYKHLEALKFELKA